MCQEAPSNHEALFETSNQNSINGIGLSVYLAARYSRKEEIKQKAGELEQLGITVTSRWLEEKADPNTTMAVVGEEFCQFVANQDIEDIDRADVFILFSEDPEKAFVRGGRHFETGYAYGINKPIIVHGPKENVFHHLNRVVIVDNWEDLKANLVFLGKVKRI
jgi:nucleoside 2-deoxyribosyltransferase